MIVEIDNTGALAENYDYDSDYGIIIVSIIIINNKDLAITFWYDKI